MNLNKNYYQILQVDLQSNSDIIKKSYYKLSFKHHPDKQGDPEMFAEITEAYDVLSNTELRNEYDVKSKFGRNYDELQELFLVNLEFDYNKENEKFEDFKKNSVLNIIVDIDDTFTGQIEYSRWVTCKSCSGTGKDQKSKLVVKDEFGNIKAVFDSNEGCDFCEGLGKDAWDRQCTFCFGQGKIGSQNCTTCQGKKRILGKQKLTKIELDKNSNETIIKAMGHFSKYEPGKVGNLILRKI